jgi:streptogramin lyase
VTTFAGNGTAGYADGTGGRNGTAEFNQPFGVATDAQGNLFVADETNNRIRKIDSQGNVTTLAGNGTYGYADGTGGPDGSAEFNAPRGVGTDAQGNVYVADFNNNRIRKIDANGNVTTLAGDGEATYGDGTGGANGTAKFNHPTGVATDAQGNAYVADYQNNRIRKIDTSGNVTTFAGNGTAGYADGAGGPHGGAEFNGPTGVAVDAQGNVYVADFDNSRIRKIDALGNTITLAGNGTPGFVDGTGGPNGTAEFSLPCAVAVDAQGNVYVADTFNSSIRKIDTNGNVTTLAGNGTPGYADGAGSSAQFLNPHGVTVDGQGNVFVADNGNARVRKIDPQGNVTTYAGNGTQANVDGPGGPNDTAEFYVPYSIAADALGNVFVGDIGDNRIRKITP